MNRQKNSGMKIRHSVLLLLQEREEEWLSTKELLVMVERDLGMSVTSDLLRKNMKVLREDKLVTCRKQSGGVSRSGVFHHGNFYWEYKNK